jgi:hypothetical protein
MAFFRSLRRFLLTDRVTLIFILLAVIENLISWAFILWKVHLNADWRTTWYSVYGTSNFGPPQTLFEIPAVGSLVFVVNTAISYFLHKRSQGYARILLGATAFLEILVLIPLFAIYYFGNIL